MRKNPIDIVSRAKATLIADNPFYAVIAMRLEYIRIPDEEAEKHWCQTACTDGRTVWWNPRFFDGLTREQAKAVIAHEVLHVALLHPLRCHNRHPRIWNVAIDIVVNQTLTDDGFTLPGIGLPVDGKPSKKFNPGEFAHYLDPKYKGWHAEKIYHDLMQNHVTTITIKFDGEDGQKGQGDNQGEGNADDKGDQNGRGWGAVIQPTDDKGNPISEAERHELEAEIKIMVAQAAAAAKSIGKVPGCVQEIVEAYTKPKVEWRDYLPTWLVGSQPDNYTWRRPARKWLHRDLIMPSIDKIGCGRGAVLIDTSGSVSSQELRRYLTEIIQIIEDCRPDEVVIVPCDTQVKGVREWTPGDDLSTLEIEGRGGTCVTPAFDWVAKNREIDWAIYFTDLEVDDFPPEQPPYPVIWLTTGQTKAPWGDVLKVQIED